MLPHREVVQRFSTFIQFANDRFESWVEDPRLKRSLEQIQFQQIKQSSLDSTKLDVYVSSQDEQLDENWWVAYWHKNWCEHQTEIALAHFYAYLQEACYWSAHKLSGRFSTTQASLSDCFQAALFRVENVLGSFKPELGIHLSTYASSIFSNAIRDLLSQHHEVQICSDGSLLRRVTRKRFLEALRTGGLDSHTIEQYEIVWLSFKAVCFPSQKTVRKGTLSQSDWPAIAQIYESRRKNLITPLPKAEATQLEAMMMDAVQHLRRALSPTTLSLNTCLEASEEFLDQITLGDDPMGSWIATEELKLRQHHQQQMVHILRQTLAALDPAAHEVLRLYYCEQLKQKEIAVELGTKQYTVSRRLSKTRQVLLAALVQWSRSDLHICLDSTVLNNISAFLEDWLQLHFSGDRTHHDAAR